MELKYKIEIKQHLETNIILTHWFVLKTLKTSQKMLSTARMQELLFAYHLRTNTMQWYYSAATRYSHISHLISCTRNFQCKAKVYQGYSFVYVQYAKLYPLVCRNFKFDTYKFTKVILLLNYIIYVFKSYF